MTDATIGSQVETISESAFWNCESLPQISIPKSVKTIGNGAFMGCTGLKEFVIEDREEELKLGTNLFTDCPLETVYIGGNISYRTESYQGYSPFYRNTTLKSVVITDKETEISTNEFYGCTSLENFTVGDGVTTFGDRAFSGCSSLKSLSFGSQLKSIGKEAFSDCGSVTQIVSKAATPPTCGTQALDDINKWNCTLNVPAGSMQAYQTADQWKEFFFIAEGEGEPVIPTTPKCATPTISYQNGKLTFSSETEGAVCQSTITDSDIRSYSANEVQLNVTYKISVYATKTGYDNSDVATAMLCWIDKEPSINGIGEIAARAILIKSEGGFMTIEGAYDGQQVSVYAVNGTQAGAAVSRNGQATIATNLQPSTIAIVKIGEKSVKVVVK